MRAGKQKARIFYRYLQSFKMYRFRNVKPFLAPGPSKNRRQAGVGQQAVCLPGLLQKVVPALRETLLSSLSSSPMPGAYGVMGDDGSMDYSVHEAWNEATNVYLVVILVSFVLFMYAKR